MTEAHLPQEAAPDPVREALAKLNAIANAVEQLACHQGQCDQDGVMVKVSRQAVDETVNCVNEVVIILAALSSAPAAAGERGGLRVDFTQALPGGKLDDTTYEKLETALDKIEAPCRAPDGRWLSLHERIAALSSPASPLEREIVAARANLKEAWSALALIRETVETLGPVGAVPASEHLDGPTFMHEAEALINGIQAMALSSPLERSPRGDEGKEHKVMTPEEYAAMPIIGWHEVCRDVDGFGATGVRFLTASNGDEK